MKRVLVLLATHGVALAIGFAAGIYVLPILIAPQGPSAVDVQAAAGTPDYKARFRKDLKGSDLLHWGEGEVAVSRKAIAFMGKLAPGPDYKLYLSPEFVETEEAFLAIKARALRVGDVKTFENFVVALPDGTDLARYDSVVVWCETFSQFITAAKYR